MPPLYSRLEDFTATELRIRPLRDGSDEKSPDGIQR
jgi:hypothetical protein